MPKIGHIIRGWGMRFGIIPTSSAEAKLSTLRLSICGACKFSQEKKLLKIINGEVTNNAALQCTQCGCPCLEKSLVIEESCPRRKW